MTRYDMSGIVYRDNLHVRLWCEAIGADTEHAHDRWR